MAYSLSVSDGRVANNCMYGTLHVSSIVSQLQYFTILCIMYEDEEYDEASNHDDDYDVYIDDDDSSAKRSKLLVGCVELAEIFSMYPVTIDVHDRSSSSSHKFEIAAAVRGVKSITAEPTCDRINIMYNKLCSFIPSDVVPVTMVDVSWCIVLTIVGDEMVEMCCQCLPNVCDNGVNFQL